MAIKKKTQLSQYARFLILAFLLIIIPVHSFFSCRHKPVPLLTDTWKSDSTLVALTLYGSTSYFIYKGEPMGYDYELLQDFAESQGLRFEIKIAPNVNRLIEMFRNGEGDLLACNVLITNALKKEFIFCGKETVNEQVIVQRGGKGDTVLTNVVQLIGKDVSVIQGSRYYQRLRHLDEELGGGIHIIPVQEDTISTEDLIAAVSLRKISYTVSDYDLARLNKTYYANINIQLKIGHPQRSSWAVRKDSPELAEKINEWFKDKQGNVKYKAIVKKYFEMSKMPGDEPAPMLSKGQISVYDPLFKHYAPTIGWDWKLLASIAYQESKFDTAGVSWAGATGLMGLMPATARAFGIEDPLLLTNPEASVKTAAAYLGSLIRSYGSVENQEERIKLVLASYNAGIGHIYDAQALAVKFGKNPHVWNGNVDECLKMKQLPEFYNDSVVKCGYCRGIETLNYVEHVMERWRYYQQKLPENKKDS